MLDLTTKLVFVTSRKARKNSIGLGDHYCAVGVQEAEHSGTFKAWLSLDQSDQDLRRRFNHSIDQYVRVDGTMVAFN